MNSEQQLQASMIIWFSQRYPERRGTLWSNFVTQNAMQANFKKSLGLVASLSDLMYIAPSIEGVRDKEFWGIELKTKGSRHEVAHIISQAKWLLSVPHRGFFCDSYEMFQDIIENKSQGIDPALILKNCLLIKKKTASWEFIKNPEQIKNN